MVIFKIMIPVYNDWESLDKLLFKINENLKDFSNHSFECFIINDASSIKKPSIKNLPNFKATKIINMKENRGHARCNAFGLRYISQNFDFDHIILMDGDGEDRPEELKLIIKKALETPDISVVAKRIKRSEGPIFQILYKAHKFITMIFTGKNVNFGNYSCLTKKDVIHISSKSSLWSSFSGTLKKYIKKLNSTDSIRGIRYCGPSQMSIFKLIVHSLSIMAVFKYNLFVRSTIFIILINYFSVFMLINLSFLIFLIVFFILVIFLVSLRESTKNLINSEKNIESVENILH